MTNIEAVHGRLIEALGTLMAVPDWHTLPPQFADDWQLVIASLLAVAGLLAAAARGQFPTPSADLIERPDAQ